MNKLENLLDIVKSNEVKINDLLHKKELEEKEITAAAGGGAVEVTVSGNFTVRKLSVYANQSLIEVSEVAEKSMLFIFLQLLKALSLIVLKPAGKVNEANEKFSAKA